MNSLPDTSSAIVSCRTIELVDVLENAFSFKVIVGNETRYFTYARLDGKMVSSFLEKFIQDSDDNRVVDLVVDDIHAESPVVLQILVDGKSIGDIDDYVKRKAIAAAFSSLFCLFCFFVFSFKYGVWMS